MDEPFFTFSWEIKNISLCITKPGDTMRSSYFVATPINMTTWIGRLDYRNRVIPNVMSFHLMRSGDVGPHCVEMSAELQLIAVDGTPGNARIQSGNYRSGQEIGFPNFVSWVEARRLYLHRDTLRMQCVFKKKNKEFIKKKFYTRSYATLQKICRVYSLTNFSQMNNRKVILEVRLFEYCLEIFAYMEDKLGQKEIQIEFRRRGIGNGFLTVNTNITLLDASWRKTDISKQDRQCFPSKILNHVWKFPDFITIDGILRDKKEYLVDDVLTMAIEIIVINDPLTTRMSRSDYLCVEVIDGHCFEEWTENMKELYNSKPFPDVSLRVSGETLLAHRMILQSRSQRFAEMLELETRDDGIVDVTDIDMVTLKRMLKYMYTDEMDDLDYDDAIVDYIAASKYKIESLKCKYSFVLQSHLKVANVCSILKLADDFCDPDLKKCVVEFIKVYWDAVSVSEVWMRLSNERRRLVEETMERLSETCILKHFTEY